MRISAGVGDYPLFLNFVLNEISIYCKITCLFAFYYEIYTIYSHSVQLACNLFFTADETQFYLAFGGNYRQTPELSIIMTSADTNSAAYRIEIPGLRFSSRGTIASNARATVSIPSSAAVSSHYHQDKGIYVTINSPKVTVVGQNIVYYTTDTFYVLPFGQSCSEEYIYYGISVARTNVHSVQFFSTILVVGTQSNTLMKVSVPQSVTIRVGQTSTNLVPGRQYSFTIQRLQTVYIASVNDLTGTRIITNKEVSVYNTHECANVPYNIAWCDFISEVIPSTDYWGTVFYTALFSTRRSYSIKMIAAFDSSSVDIYCNNRLVENVNLNAGQSAYRIYQYHCAIYSNKKILLMQFAHGQGDDGAYGDPFMALVPSTMHYTNNFDVSAVLFSHRTFNHYVNVIVPSQHYQTYLIYSMIGSTRTSLQFQSWQPIYGNNGVAAYVLQMRLSSAAVKIYHTRQTARLTAMAYGFTSYESYGHPAIVNSAGMIFC